MDKKKWVKSLLIICFAMCILLFSDYSESLENNIFTSHVNVDVCFKKIEKEISKTVIETKPVKEEVVSKPVEEEIVSKPVEKKVVSKPVEQKVVSQPVVEEKVASQPVAEEKISVRNSQVRTQGSMEEEVLDYMNQYRAEVGLSQLVMDSNLCKVAELRVEEIAIEGNFSHTRPNGSICFTAFEELGITYRSAGENLGKGYSTSKAVSEAWKTSKLHYENIIEKSFNKIGIAVMQNELGNYYWVEIFSN